MTCFLVNIFRGPKMHQLTMFHDSKPISIIVTYLLVDILRKPKMPQLTKFDDSRPISTQDTYV